MLKVENVYAGYSEYKILQDISMEVPIGKTIILVGPNGAGKSTLLKTIMGTAKLTSGRIYFNGKLLNNKKTPEIIEIGISIVPEGGRLFQELTVFDNLRIGSYPKRARKHYREQMDKVFQLFPILQSRQKQIAGSLSGGERQMLAISRTLMSRPELILLDEPSQGLAPKVLVTLFGFVKEIKTQGYSLLMVEQNMRKALELADYAYLMESGCIKFHDEKTDFLNSYSIKKTYLGI